MKPLLSQQHFWANTLNCFRKYQAASKFQRKEQRFCGFSTLTVRVTRTDVWKHAYNVHTWRRRCVSSFLGVGITRYGVAFACSYTFISKANMQTNPPHSPSWTYGVLIKVISMIPSVIRLNPIWCDGLCPRERGETWYTSGPRSPNALCRPPFGHGRNT